MYRSSKKKRAHASPSRQNICHGRSAMGSSRVRSTPPRLEGLKYRTYGSVLYMYAYRMPALALLCPLAPEFESVNGCKKLD